MVQVIDTGPNPWSQGINRFFQAYTPKAIERSTQYDRNRQMTDLLSRLPKNATAMDLQRLAAEANVHPEVMNQLLGTVKEQRAEYVAQSGKQKAADIFGQLGENPSLQQIQKAVTEAQRSGVPQELIKSQMDLYEPLIKQRAKTAGSEQLLRSILPGYAPASGGGPQEQGGQSALGQVMQPQQVGQPQQGQQQQQAFDITQVPENSLVQLASSPYPEHQNLAQAELKRRENEHKKFTEDRKFHAKGAEKTEERVSGMRESIPKKKMALNLARDAVQSGEVGILSLANLAERTGAREFQTAKGAQLVTAGKENLLSNMSRVSAKGQNQWFEQRLNSMFPQIGQSMEANETIDAMLQGELEMDEAYLRAYNELAKQDEDNFGYKRNDLDQRTHEIVDDLYDDIMKKTSYKMREIYEREKGISWMKENVMKKVPNGTPLTPQMAKVLSNKYGGNYAQAIENAKRLGYQIPTKEEFAQWQ